MQINFDTGAQVWLSPFIETIEYKGTDYAFNDFARMAFEAGGKSASEAQSEVDSYLAHYNSELATLTRVTAEDPVVLDLDGDGVEPVDIYDSTALFDMAGTGGRQQTGWVAADDAILVVDLNHNGLIDDRTELLSEHFKDETFVDGEAALASLDENADGVIDQSDAGYAALLLWQDLNQDGVSDDGELSSLQERGVESINLGWTPLNDAEGTTELVAEGSFDWEDGSSGVLQDVGFAYVTNIGDGAVTDEEGFLRRADNEPDAMHNALQEDEELEGAGDEFAEVGENIDALIEADDSVTGVPDESSIELNVSATEEASTDANALEGAMTRA